MISVTTSIRMVRIAEAIPKEASPKVN